MQRKKGVTNGYQQGPACIFADETMCTWFFLPVVADYFPYTLIVPVFTFPARL